MFYGIFRKRKILRGAEIEDSIMTVTEKEKAIIETPFKRKGLNFIWFSIVFVLILIFLRVFYLGVMMGDHYSDIANGNRIRLAGIKAPRGKIMDKFGNVLASNVPSMDVVVISHDLPENLEERKSVIKIISEVLDMEAGNVEMALEVQNKRSIEPILLKENITRDQALILAERAKDIPGINVENTAIRSYENGSIFATFIGYDGKITQDEWKNNPSYSRTDYIGKTGLEKYYESDLKGKNGAKRIEVDSRGNTKKNLGIIQPESGKNLYLNVDEGLQKKIYDSLASALEKTETKTAAAVAIDPRNGGVLAMVSFPNFDNNLFARGISNDDYKKIIGDKNLPLFNRAVSGEYPPGSTIKPGYAAAALMEGIVRPETTVNDNIGAINVGSWRFGDWKIHGITDLRKAIAESCDVYFYAIGGGYGNIKGLGIAKMKEYANLFGLGLPTKIDLPGEASGFFPTEAWKLEKLGERWYIGNSYHASIGQGYITTTPIQLATHTASLANWGTLYQPRLVNRIQKNDGSVDHIQPEVIRSNFVPKDVMRVVREGMRQTVTSGTAQQLKDLDVEVAGKTGTAQFGGENKTHGWFISFAPYENPEIALVILAEGESGDRSIAVPVTKEVYEWYFKR
ncbi:MAG TPA: penicillin-binding protein 2 [Candidatus Moranbacteria bacterium]|nr:penicillin-binding protein 2 [Candidatus Moranbacteria bacterium]